MKKNDIDIDDDMSKTFIAEVGQKSAIADDEEVLEKNTIESNFSDISIEPPKEEINTNEIGTNIEEKETKPRYEEESSMYDETKKKKSNPLLTVLLMILALAIGAGGSYYYFEVLNKEEVSTKVEEKEEVKDTVEELKPDGVFVKELIDKYHYPTVHPVDIYRYLYSKEKILASELDDTYKRVLVYDESYRNSIMHQSISGKTFQENAIKLFGSKANLENQSINSDELCVNATYDQANDLYDTTVPICGSVGVVDFNEKIVKAQKLSDKTITVNIAIAVVSGVDSENKVYKTYDIETKTGKEELIGITAETFDIDKDYTKLNQYQYTFKYDKDNSNYYLESIELIK